MKPQMKLFETLNETLYKWNLKWNPTGKWKPKEPSREKQQNVANTMQMRGWNAKIWQIPCKMEGKHGQV